MDHSISKEENCTTEPANPGEENIFQASFDKYLLTCWSFEVVSGKKHVLMPSKATQMANSLWIQK